MDCDADYLIIGQGIAGSVLADKLLARGQRVLVVDDGHRTSSTRVAAGMINPLAGKRLALSPGSDWLLPAAKGYFAQLEARTGTRVFHPLPIRRVLRNTNERKRLEKKRAIPTYTPYIGEVSPPGSLGDVNDPHGSFITLGGGYVASGPLLSSLRERLRQANALAEVEFHHEDLELLPAGVRWQGRVYQTVVFCEGMRLRDNPWFSDIVTDPVKGEILDLKLPNPPEGEILNKGKWLLPQENGQVRLGATYERSCLDTEPTPEGREQLMDALRQIFPEHPGEQVVAQAAGVRVCTPDNQPLIGRHREHPALALFNGFGSKGNSLVPGWAEVFTASLVGAEMDQPLPTLYRS
ncbi:FAD-dependent oxidoreductase [Ruficoccus sp. ZRK36]|uniref:NAD(P)/FAD-dependent oxidoreductase n=1 Tax=Ruficoccus sp. ZRK36 TaxID=2866311 RepID=UPI001C73DB2B|nr:FAD-dependent oxidoreductase [Ruficoccus sp. ZRK36]QYY35910.1 FAD-binding oxidoreductase [Ruficoccus sp. ZRK36]